jgi:p-aminobenzoyl-glutamate transporter AbgT
MDWMNWTNFAYAMVLVFTIMGTMVAQKYRIVVKELKDVAQKYKEASKDGNISEKEKEQLAKECMDVIMALVKLVWRF